LYHHNNILTFFGQQIGRERLRGKKQRLKLEESIRQLPGEAVYLCVAFEVKSSAGIYCVVFVKSSTPVKPIGSE
jgi:hypothetical protein